jgi:hypothetical protein
MSNKTLYLRGKFEWCKLNKPDPKFDVYTLDFYPDADAWNVIQQEKIQLKQREGKDGTYIKLRRPVTKKSKNELVQMGAPQVMLQSEDGTHEPFTGNIGNGSAGVVKVRIYDTVKGVGHELISVMVEELVPYDNQDITASDDIVPF